MECGFCLPQFLAKTLIANIQLQTYCTALALAYMLHLISDFSRLWRKCHTATCPQTSSDPLKSETRNEPVTRAIVFEYWGKRLVLSSKFGQKDWTGCYSWASVTKWSHKCITWRAPFWFLNILFDLVLFFSLRLPYVKLRKVSYYRAWRRNTVTGNTTNME